jgi:hypothetical protein
MVKNIFEYERKKAVDTLVSLGAVRYVRDMDLYHGRAGDGSEWEVDPKFNNGGNNTGNRNVYKVSGLYAGSQAIAKEFAEKRVRRGAGSVPEVHKIVSYDKNAILFNLNFDEYKLNPANREKYYSALRTLCSFGITQDNPVKYEYKVAVPLINQKCVEIQYKYNTHSFAKEHIDIIFSELKDDERIKRMFPPIPKRIIWCLTICICLRNVKREIREW